ncbi:unnamed protein product [Pleuronectes platessa]|uniref:Uncharacterized protein n=1 Tax=Pleuronectes platessa TaxID=8262 RepID=A0A9N7TRU0_PLEPL|nr:unnamed protein product [Pleuronectes platessa]
MELAHQNAALKLMNSKENTWTEEKKNLMDEIDSLKARNDLSPAGTERSAEGCLSRQRGLESENKEVHKRFTVREKEVKSLNARLHHQQAETQRVKEELTDFDSQLKAAKVVQRRMDRENKEGGCFLQEEEVAEAGGERRKTTQMDREADREKACREVCRQTGEKYKGCSAPEKSYLELADPRVSWLAGFLVKGDCWLLPSFLPPSLPCLASLLGGQASRTRHKNKPRKERLVDRRQWNWTGDESAGSAAKECRCRSCVLLKDTSVVQMLGIMEV